MSKTLAPMFDLYDVLQNQIAFQKSLGNELPTETTTFDNVQMSLSHSIYQNIEFQEFMEADNLEDRKEELIDYLLFMLNKYIFLADMTVKRILTANPIDKTLWSCHEEQSFAQCSHLASLEQETYITLIRNHCTFKPWKKKNGDDCAPDADAIFQSFARALKYFKQMANIVFDSGKEFYDYLEMKMQKNIDRQSSGY